MDELLRLFVGRPPPAPPSYDPARILAIRQRLEQHEAELRAKSDHFHALAVQARDRRKKQWRTMNTPRAQQVVARHDMIWQHLGYSRALDGAADRVAQQLLTLDRQFEALNQHEASRLTIEALRAGNAALRAAQAQLDATQIDKVQADMEATLEAVQETTERVTEQPAVDAAVLLDPDEADAFLNGADDDWESSGDERATVTVTAPPAAAAIRTARPAEEEEYEAVALI